MGIGHGGRVNALDTTSAPTYELRFPQRDESGVAQDEEWCEVLEDGRVTRIRFHDYADIFDRPGLYEQLFAQELECESPDVVVGLLAPEAKRRGIDLRVLDVGAGNGMVGEELRAAGAEVVVGCDILPEAKRAALRDRPGVYDDYVAADLTDLPPADRKTLEDARFNALTIVAALGFGDIPCEAFVSAFDMVADGGLVAFNIKQEFLGTDDGSGFAQLVKRAADDGTIEVVARKPYRHRLSVTGEALHYVAFVGVKRRDLGAGAC